MALKTYGELKGALKWWANNRDDIDVISQDCVALCEGHLNLDLRCREMLTRVTLTPVDGKVTLPEDFIGVYSVVEQYGATPRVLTPLSESIMVLQHGHAGTSPSVNYTIVGDELQTGPSASSDLDIVYYKALTPLEEDADTNWLLKKYPAIYLEGAQMEIYRALKMDKDLQISSARFNLMLDKLTESEDFTMMSSASPPASAGNVF